MKSNFLFKSLFIIFAFVLVVSCDKDFNEIGSDLVDDNNFKSDIFTSDINSLEAFNQATGPVQTSNLPVNSLGYLNNAPFGSTTFSFVTQLNLGTLSPTYVAKPIAAGDIEKIYLYVPCFSHITSTNSDGDSFYALDSVIGNSQIKLSVYRSGYYLRDLDEGTSFQDKQKYYSNQQPEIDAAKGQLLFEDNLFKFSSDQIKFSKDNEDGSTGSTVVRLAPGIFKDFDDTMKTYFINNVLNAPESALSDNKLFEKYFRGLYFKVDNLSGNTSSAMARLDFAKGKIVIIYKEKEKASDTDRKLRKTLELNMAGNTVNLFQNDGYTPQTDNKRIVLKGGEGSMAVLNLFGGLTNNSSIDLNTMRREKWLINEASITFNVDETEVSSIQPKRIYLFDLQNKRPLIDYYYDASTATNSKYNKYVYGGILVKDNGYLPSSSERGTKYKIRITNYLRSLVKNGLNDSPYRKNIDSTNVKLGLVVTEAITNPSNVYIENFFSFTGFDYSNGASKLLSNKYIPAMSIVNPLGVKLYGANFLPSDLDYNKRMKLEIKYTKPN